MLSLLALSIDRYQVLFSEDTMFRSTSSISAGVFPTVLAKILTSYSLKFICLIKTSWCEIPLSKFSDISHCQVLSSRARTAARKRFLFHFFHFNYQFCQGKPSLFLIRNPTLSNLQTCCPPLSEMFFKTNALS